METVIVEGRHLVDAGMSSNGWSRKTRGLCAKRRALAEAGVPEGEEREALVRGSLVHVGVAHLYARQYAIQEGYNPDAYHEPGPAMEIVAQREHARSVREERDGSGLWLELLPKVQGALDAYAVEYMTERLRIVGVEHLVEFDVVGPHTGQVYRHTARMDLIAKMHGKIWVIDHKTYARGGKTKRRGFELAGQTVGAIWWGRAAYGDDFGGFMINGIQVNASPGDCRFERFQPAIAPAAIAKFPAAVERYEEIWRQDRERYGDNPDNYPGVYMEQGPCLDRYGPCGYRKVCRWGLGIRGQDA